MQKLVHATQKVEYIVIWGYRMQHYFFLLLTTYLADFVITE